MWQSCGEGIRQIYIGGCPRIGTVRHESQTGCIMFLKYKQMQIFASIFSCDRDPFFSLNIPNTFSEFPENKVSPTKKHEHIYHPPTPKTKKHTKSLILIRRHDNNRHGFVLPVGVVVSQRQLLGSGVSMHHIYLDTAWKLSWGWDSHGLFSHRNPCLDGLFPYKKNIPRWWQLKHFLEFSPRKLGKISNLTNIFSDGLKPPTRYEWTKCRYNILYIWSNYDVTRVLGPQKVAF